MLQRQAQVFMPTLITHNRARKTLNPPGESSKCGLHNWLTKSQEGTKCFITWNAQHSGCLRQKNLVHLISKTHHYKRLTTKLMLEGTKHNDSHSTNATHSWKFECTYQRSLAGIGSKDHNSHVKHSHVLLTKMYFKILMFQCSPTGSFTMGETAWKVAALACAFLAYRHVRT